MSAFSLYEKGRIGLTGDVMSNDIITTAGLLAWPALGLRLVERLRGGAVAAATARFLEIDHIDMAGQAARHFSPALGHGDGPILHVQHWLQASGAVDVSLHDMARRAGMEERTFLRRFRAATGLRPTEYCQHVRVGNARQSLEYSLDKVEHIAWAVGYQDPAAFRGTFKKITGLTPSNYRSQFGLRAPSQALP